MIVEPWFSPERFEVGRIGVIHIDRPKLKISRMNRTRAKGNVSQIQFHYLVGRPHRIVYFTELHELGLFTHREHMQAFRSIGLKV